MKYKYIREEELKNKVGADGVCKSSAKPGYEF